MSKQNIIKKSLTSGGNRQRYHKSHERVVYYEMTRKKKETSFRKTKRKRKRKRKYIQLGTFITLCPKEKKRNQVFIGGRYKQKEN